MMICDINNDIKSYVLMGTEEFVPFLLRNKYTTEDGSAYYAAFKDSKVECLEEFSFDESYLIFPDDVTHILWYFK